MIVRLVKKEDVELIWKIRNHPNIRLASSNTQEFLLADHNKWFIEKYFTDQDNLCYVLEDDRVIGYCRFDYDKKNNYYVVSIAIDPDYHGKGLGNQLIYQSLSLFIQTKKVVKVFAEIKKDNNKSLGLFKKNNFMIADEDENNLYLIYENN